MNRKILAVGIILLFVGTCIIPAIAQDTEKTLLTSRGNWLYVGGSGPGNYTNIQEAINNASSGDTVFVYDDLSPYNEEVVIRKSINLIGEDKNTTLITTANYGAFSLNIKYTEHVLISGFRTKDSYGGLAVVNSNYSIINENIFEEHFFNLYMTYSNNNTIKNNVIHHGSGEGILFFPSCNNNQIIDNVFSENCEGSIHFLDYCNNNKIINNTLFQYDECMYISDNCNYNLIQGNKINQTSAFAILLSSNSNNSIINNYIDKANSVAILISNVEYALIKDNTIENSLLEGIYLKEGAEQPVRYNIVENNTLLNNKRCGLFLRWADNNTIRNNIIKNSPKGIEIHSFFTGLNQESNFNTIIGNVIENNSIGILLNGSGYNTRTPVRFNTIRNNVLSKNDYGIKSQYSWDNLIYHNNFYNNTVNAYDDNSNIWYYSLVNEGNYWDNYDEPDEGAYDNDSNGIIDRPYQIPGGDSQDLYPLKNPYTNQQPKKPNVPKGNTTGVAGESYSYTSNTTDSENDTIFYKFSWGDYTETSWIGPYPSGNLADASHTWREGETYHIQVNAMDEHGEESDWSDPLEIHLTGPDIQIMNVKGGFGVKIFIKNVGNADITNVNWSIQYLPSNSIWMIYPLKKYSNGVIPVVRTGKTVIIKDYILGLGNSQCYISIEMERVTKGFYVVGPFVLIKNPL